MGAQKQDTLSYLALGDSYTIGESVAAKDRYPVQVQTLVNQNLEASMSDPTIIATTGWTTDELQAGIAKAQIEGKTYDYVSLLIGVNNQYRGYPITQYKEEFESLLKQALSFADNNSQHLVVISIPDYGVTPFGMKGDKDKIARELDQYNMEAKAIASRYGVDFLDITPISREAASSPDLIAEDDLHPSDLQYTRWVEEVIYPWFLEKIAQ